MSQRERPGAAGASPPPASADTPAPRPAVPRNGDAGPEWESLFPSLAPAQQHELLTLAARQGFLSATQVPPAPAGDRSRTFFNALLHGPPPDLLPPFRPEPLDPIDSELDPTQVDAVIRAVQTPDVALIRGGPGTGKSRVIAEVIRQAAKRGQRVLLTSPTPAALDVVLERLAEDTSVVALRCVGRGETPSGVAAERTLAAVRREFADHAATRSRQNLDAATRRLTQARADAAVLERLAALARRVAESKAQLEAAVAGLASPGVSDGFAHQLAADQAQHDANLSRLQEAERAAVDEFQTAQKRIAELDAQLAANQQADTQRGWLAKLLPFGSGRAAQVEGWKQELEQQRVTEGRAKKRAEEIALERQQLDEAWVAEREHRLHGEIERRRAEHAARQRTALDEIAATEPDLRRCAAELSPECRVADVLDPACVAKAQQALARPIEQTEREETFARRWIEYLAEHGTELPYRILDSVNLVAAPLSSIAQDETLAELTRDGPLDLLILDEAQRVQEPDLLSAARRAARWVLVGEAPEEIVEPRRGSRPARIGPWQRLWQAVHSDCWRVENGRVCCRLRPLIGARPAEIEVERVADSPDIELRIWSPPRGEPALAEVLFPAGTTVEQALEYLHRELNEVPAPVATPRWTESDGRLTCRLFDGPAPRSASLATGIIARLHDTSGTPRVTALEFDVAAGWDRPRAEAWVKQSLRFTDTGRTAALVSQHRMRPGVAALACALGFEGVCPAVRPAPPGTGLAVEFIPVPALANEPQARRRGDVGYSSQQRRLPPLRGGAGFDIDLADSRQRERLPADIHPTLPPRGFVNLPEAEAVVRLLENLVSDLPTSPTERPASIAVLPLYDGQTELVRRFMAESAILKSSPVSLHVAAANSFRQREADLVIVSLTRSHGHRAVSYGDEPAAVPLALTRARQRLVLVGDPGTLARRSHWDGPLDHLDGDAARRERDWVAALVRLLQGNGPATIHLREGPP